MQTANSEATGAEVSSELHPSTISAASVTMETVRLEGEGEKKKKYSTRLNY